MKGAAARSAAGAVSVKNDKGEYTTQRVKVKRYIRGQRPEFAKDDDYSDSEVEELQIPDEDARGKTEGNLQRNKPVAEILGGSSSEQEQSDGGEDDEEEDEEAIARRRERAREKMRQRAAAIEEDEEAAAEMFGGAENEEDELSLAEEDEESEYESYTDSSDEEQVKPMLKPVFVSKNKRNTVMNKEKIEEEERRQQQLLEEREARRIEESKALLAKAVIEEIEAERAIHTLLLDDIDGVNQEEEIAAWKVRELKRIKRDRAEREKHELERLEKEKIEAMTEEEREKYFATNPKYVVNAKEKGKQKFMQKYYHRGAFYLDEEEEVLKRNTNVPTLEDHFDKAALPKVMQVKNFGKIGRTKYTHLKDQDTTDMSSAWASKDTAKYEPRRAGLKDYDRSKRRRD